MKTKLLGVLVAACMLAFPAKADTVPGYVGDLTKVGIAFYLSQPFTFQPGETVNFGSAILFTPGPSSVLPCDPATSICVVPGIYVGWEPWFGPAPTAQQINQIERDLTGDFGSDLCGLNHRPCDPPSQVIQTLKVILPSDQDTVSLFFYSWGEPTIIAPAVPLPGALPLFATGLGALGLLGWRRKRNYARGSLHC